MSKKYNIERKLLGLDRTRKNRFVMTRKEAREILLGLLFESEFRADESAEDIYYTSAENREIDDDDYIKRAYFAIFEHKVQIDTVIGEHAKGWKTHRLTNISRSILRLAVYEMLYADIPVSMTNYNEINKMLYGNKLSTVKIEYERNGETKVVEPMLGFSIPGVSGRLEGNVGYIKIRGF